MFKRKEFLTIFVIMVTETLGFSLILPFLPFYAQDLGASPLVIGMILSSFSFFQFFSAPIMGRLSDIYGRKPLLIISQISTLVGFIILGLSNSIWLVFLSRIVDGALGSNFSIAQAYISDISTKDERSTAMGISGAAFGFGFLIGPALGGILAEINYSLPAFVAAFITLITIITTKVYLEETVVKKDDVRFKLSDINLLDFSIFKDIKKNQNIYAYFILFLAFIFSHSIFVSSYALYGERQLGFGITETGYTLAFVGLTNVIIRGFLLGKLIKIFSERTLEKVGTFAIALCFLILIFVKVNYLFYLSIILFAFGSSITRPLLIGTISKNIDDLKQGSLMGFLNSMVSVSQIVTPLIGGFIINSFLPGYLPGLSFIILIVGVLYSVKIGFQKNLNIN